MSDVTIAAESPRQPEIVRLLEALDLYLEALYPPDSNHLLDIEALAQPNIRFLVARNGEGSALGCAALRVFSAEGYGELKRMYVDPAARGLKIGRRLLAAIEDAARGEGLAAVRLETGIAQPEAIGLYRAAGYREGPPFGEYRPDPLSLFMERVL
ncbi:GNAT family N-acetyltransferase [Segnochrobactrum spirostomi]|uniref:GNAT family N-acetyltransferase n=1 Tax=Segnochrobactrum spirostomi TaxID=2608987 RepID=A0A6A7Y1V3_9HYPH|nr:GNAT family N-acetyltransferase [Segnochrobactrum spirostomi]MQT12101.1 GNAT family N-acetyltransferase [Segnochrobactrum spirostomi]